MQIDKYLYRISKMLLEMGALIEKNIAQAIQALLTNDQELALKTIADDDEVNQIEKSIQEVCMQTILRFQPVAKDLRLVTAALKIITDMERIGDHAADISELVLKLTAKTNTKVDDINQMSKSVSKMLKNSIDAYANQDLEAAKQIVLDDAVVDNYYDEVKLAVIHTIKNSNVVEDDIDYLLIAKYLEKIGDHSVNIANWVHYSVNGEFTKNKK